MTEREYAKHRGCSRSSVQEARRTGRLSTSITRIPSGGVRIDADVADAEWTANTRPSGDGGESAWQRAHARKEAALAARVERENLVAEGKLIPVADVEARWTTIIVNSKTKLLAIPSRVKQQLPHLALADIATIDDLVREALVDLAAGGGKDRSGS